MIAAQLLLVCGGSLLSGSFRPHERDNQPGTRQERHGPPILERLPWGIVGLGLAERFADYTAAVFAANNMLHKNAAGAISPAAEWFDATTILGGHFLPTSFHHFVKA
jgi:hypothetical protein